MGGHRLRLPFAVAVTVLAAGAATLLLRPRGGLIQGAAVDPTAYFSPAELERVRDFRGPQRAIGIGGLALSLGTLAVLALRPPPAARRALEAAGRRPVLGAAAAGAGLSLVLVVVTLPLDAVAHSRARDVGLATQGWPAWLGDVARAAAISAVLSGVGATVLLGLGRRFPRRWWLPASSFALVVGVLFVFLSPILLEPVFNRFSPLPRGPLRADVLDLARRAGVDVGEVYRVDASRRTTGANAYVGGLGETKRVVLYDNLIEDFPPDQLRAVVAHELGHVKNRDLLRGLAWLAIVTPAAMLLVQRLVERVGPDSLAGPQFERSRAAAPGYPPALPALALALAAVALPVGAAGNVLSRQVEAHADQFALELTRDPAAAVALERRFVPMNVADPDPPGALHAVFGTHPKIVDRIGAALAWARAEEPAHR
jgi:STE24 endopeptidase